MRLIDGDALVYELTELIRYSTGEYKHGITAARFAAMTAPAVGVWNTGTPEETGWYLVYAPGYTGGSSTHREYHGGIMFAKWNGKVWSIERCYYNRPGCVKAWMPLPEAPEQ